MFKIFIHKEMSEWMYAKKKKNILYVYRKKMPSPYVGVWSPLGVKIEP